MSEININHPPLEDRPLVTFALFAYNQEKYIREAVEGAFAQTYEPLEIILSDDCSTDRTFEMMEEKAEEYKGKHDVKVLRSESNLGTAAHVMKVAQLSRGGLIVLAAGDDISKSNRVAKLVDAWKETGAWGLYSYFDKINDKGTTLSKSVFIGMPEHPLRRLWANGLDMKLIHGATSAYSRLLFDEISGDVSGIYSEDGIMSCVIHMQGKHVVFVEESLVQYRLHDNALTNKNEVTQNSFKAIESVEYKICKGNNSYLRFDEWLLGYCFDKVGYIVNPPLLDLVRNDMEFRLFVIEWANGSNVVNNLLFALTRAGRLNKRWLIPRLFGLKFYSFIKVIVVVVSKELRSIISPLRM